MIAKTALQNKKIYLNYNNFRKQIFTELAPKDSEAILYLLPWLMSINNPSFPGYVKNLKKHIRVVNVDLELEIMKREAAFKKMFDFRSSGSLLRIPREVCWIQGIYTIGSIGTIAQTSHSDCDIWVCIDKKDFDDTTLMQLRQKINLIKDWLDANLKIPVYFFVTDVEDIRNCNFGNIDLESSGSAQRNVLKEEFYRTSILICGKIPFWWICFDKEKSVDYEKMVKQLSDYSFGDDDFIDLGNLEMVKREEYFGAALWQYNKSLTHPLKSIIKMLLLKMFLDSDQKELLCHRLRRVIFAKGPDQAFTDPSLLTMNAVLEYSRRFDEETFEFIMKCFYLRYEIRLNLRKVTLKEKFAGELFKRHRINREEIDHLNNFSSWNFNEQSQFGSSIFSLLMKIYSDIMVIREGIAGEIDPQDLTIIGRKLSSCLEKKPHKIPVLHKPTENVNLPSLIFKTNGRVWQVFHTQDGTAPVVAGADIVYCIAFLVWNDIYLQPHIRMLPNATSVTMQEIMNLAKKIKEVFGAYNISTIDLENFLDEERFTKMLLVISFEESNNSKNINDFSLLYSNNWGELFVRRFDSTDKLKAFLEKNRKLIEGKKMDYYVQRNSVYYEKIIERTKSLVGQIIYI